MTKIDNHRLLKPNEVIRKGDIVKNPHTGQAQIVRGSIGSLAGLRAYRGLEFWRRKHTKKVVAPAPAAVAKYPTVTFKYNYLQREVQMIELDSKYVTGLEVTHEGGKNKYQFKKFLRSRLQSAVELVKLADKA